MAPPGIIWRQPGEVVGWRWGDPISPLSWSLCQESPAWDLPALPHLEWWGHPLPYGHTKLPWGLQMLLSEAAPALHSTWTLQMSRASLWHTMGLLCGGETLPMSCQTCLAPLLDYISLWIRMQPRTHTPSLQHSITPSDILFFLPAASNYLQGAQCN